MSITVLLLSFIATTALSFCLTWYVRNAAIARGLVQQPTLLRHVHRDPVPRLGGIAIASAFIAVSFFAHRSLDYANGTPGYRHYFWLIGPPLMMFLVGLYDDLRQLSARMKLAFQFIAGLLLFVGGYRVVEMPHLLGDGSVGAMLSAILTVAWVILITNAFNLIDGLDGLSAGSAFFSTVTVFVVSLVNQNYIVALLSVILAGSILGFLRFNFNPATIFLGDCGSLFIGCTLSALSLAGAQQKSSTIVAVSIPIICFGMPIVETTISIMRRYLNGQKILKADREHIHHKLIEKGMSQRQAVILLYAISALFGFISLFVLYPGGPAVAVVLLVVAAGIIIGMQHLGYHEIFELGRVARRTLVQRQIIVNNLVLRRASEKLCKVTSFVQVCAILTDTFQRTNFDGYILKMGVPFSYGAKVVYPNEFIWQQPSRNGNGHPSHALWSVTLNLVDGMTSVGSLCLYACGYEPILMDVDLLTTELTSALLEANRRLVKEPITSQVIQARAESATSVTAD